MGATERVIPEDINAAVMRASRVSCAIAAPLAVARLATTWAPYMHIWGELSPEVELLRDLFVGEAVRIAVLCGMKGSTPFMM